MTELEKIAYAKTFIDKLANGINPLNDKSVPDSDIVNNVRLSRCFFYVSDILRQVIDNGGIKPEKKNKPKKLPFSITYEERAKFAYSQMPLTISEIADMIDNLGKKENHFKLKRKNIIGWLIENNILKEMGVVNGKTRRLPTDFGKEIGLLVDLREGIRGHYEVIMYDINAQHFIIDNMDAILAFDEKTEESADKIN